MSTNKQAQAIISDIKLKHGSGDVYVPIIRWDEFQSITGALEAAEKRIADQQATLNAARSYVKAHAAGDGHAFGVLQAIDRAAGISVKGE